ncbi:MFS transporter [Pseudomonas paeninsulae]|uniref:hypothetical protein n=1 Tax=Pseudomonas paeninsulae TaxID=3110772 RepID=UPI002D7A1046|nr:hypothetical protein [Pseudomonas sp. IT1137]
MFEKPNPLPGSLSSRGRFTLLAVACLIIMVGTVVAPGLAIISSALGVSSHASWLVTLPALGVILFAPLAGRLIDRVGAYTALQIGLASYGLLGIAGRPGTGVCRPRIIGRRYSCGDGLWHQPYLALVSGA